MKDLQQLNQLVRPQRHQLNVEYLFYRELVPWDLDAVPKLVGHIQHLLRLLHVLRGAAKHR